MKVKKFGLLLVLIFLFNHLNAQVKSNTQTKQDPDSSASMLRGKVVYKAVCLACHMEDGRGVPNMNPPLINTTYVLGDKTTLVKIVLNGFNEDVEINGKTYGNNMTPHSDLSDRQIADVLTYVRKSFGNKASLVTPVEVKKIRAANIK